MTNRAVIEAILFIAGDPVPVEDLAHSLNLTLTEANMELDALQASLLLDQRGILLNRAGNSVYLSINPNCTPQVELFLQPVRKKSLSQAVLETLAIIAYNQPATKGDIEAIRGVKSDYSVQTLLTRGLIEECGQRETLGRPTLYKTTDAFLKHFGLTNLQELPKKEEAQQENESSAAPFETI